MLLLKDIQTHYGRLEVLRRIFLEENEGEIVAVLGANGAGKTTLLKTISGLIKPTLGQIEFFGRRIDGLAPKNVVEMGICHVPEGRGMFPYMTVLDNLELGAVRRRDKSEIKKDLEHVYGLFPPLRARAKQLAGSLSGGEQQMVTIGRGLMSKPKLCLLDEPSLGLAPIMVKEVSLIIRNINEQGVTVLLVEQNARMALSVAHKGYVLEMGKVVLKGLSGDLMQNEDVKKAYLGM
jgi:branched-chain amino acid transport system ATP-binding protein